MEDQGKRREGMSDREKKKRKPSKRLLFSPPCLSLAFIYRGEKVVDGREYLSQWACQWQVRLDRKAEEEESLFKEIHRQAFRKKGKTGG